MYIKTFFISFLLLFASCSSLNINLTQNKIQLLKDNSVVIEGSGSVKHTNKLKLSNIKIIQKVYQMKNSSILTVEQLQADSGYSFDGGMKKTIWIGFGNHIYSKEYSKGNLSFFTLKNKTDNSMIYLIAQNQNKKRIQLVYGKNEKLFYGVVEALKNDTSIKDISELQNVTQEAKIDPKSYIQTTWSEKNIIVDGLVHKDGGAHIKSIR